jgi:hypothetical protein
MCGFYLVCREIRLQRFALLDAPLVALLLEPGRSLAGSRRSLLVKRCFTLPLRGKRRSPN